MENERFLKLLEMAGLIEKNQFAALEKNETPEDIFDALEITQVPNSKLSQVYAKFRDIPFVDIQSIDPSAREIISPEIARRYSIIPFFVDEDDKILQIAITDPRKYLSLNKDNLDELGKKIGYKIEVMMASKSQVESFLREESSSQGDEENSFGNSISDRPINEQELKNLSSTNKIPELVDGIIAYSIFHRASDIHIEPFEQSVRIRIRVDGLMEDVLALPSSQLSAISARIKILSKLKIEEERVPQDGRFDIIFKNNQVDIRVSTLPTIFGEKLAMRLLPKTKNLVELEHLGILDKAYENLDKAIHQNYGLIIATGPTGSGKTTTLYSILGKLDRSEVEIMTLEETVEYELPRVNQVKLQSHLGFGYAEGLRSVLKQDPNIIYVGEITDKETAELVVHATLTGRLVLTTLHTNDSIQALPRLINMGVDPFLLTSALRTVIAQRLVRKLCGECREQIQLSTAAQAVIKAEIGALNPKTPMIFYKARGCEKCKSGYAGRLGIFGVLPINSKIQSMIIDRKSDKEIMAAAKESGFITMRQDGFLKAGQGLTTIDEVIKATSTGDNE